jgi:methyl-accepting chemotaxis protein
MGKKKPKVYTAEAIKELVEENGHLSALVDAARENAANAQSLANDRRSAITRLEDQNKQLCQQMDRMRQDLDSEKMDRRRELLDIIRWQVNPETAVDERPDRMSGGWRG